MDEREVESQKNIFNQPSKVDFQKKLATAIFKNKGSREWELKADELTPRQFVDVYMRLIPYIVQMRHLQNIEVGELSKDETREIIKDIVKDENPK